MFRAIDEAAFVAEREPKYLGRRQLRPLRVIETSGGCRKHFVAAVLLIRVQPHPLVYALNETDLLCAMVLVLLAIGASLPNRNHTNCPPSRDSQVENVVGHRNADPI